MGGGGGEGGRSNTKLNATQTKDAITTELIEGKWFLLLVLPNKTKKYLANF